MFPEITRDEVFRIETPRLWLRWPMCTDSDALAAVMAQGCSARGSTLAHVNAHAVSGLIEAWRAEMEAGTALHLLIVPKAGARRPIGIIHSGTTRGCLLAGQRTLGDEAAQAWTTMLDVLGVRPARRNPPMAHQRPVPQLETVAACCLQA